MAVTELSREQLIELKQDYLCRLADCGERPEPSWMEIAEADSIVPDSEIFSDCEGVYFVPDDFFCTAGR